MKKTLSIILVILTCAVVVAFVAWNRVPDMLSTRLSKALGVGVSIGGMGITPASLSMKNLEIGNPAGSILAKAFSCGLIGVNAPLTRYLSDDIVIEEIRLENVYLGLEFKNAKGTDGNWTVIMGNLQKSIASEQPKESKGPSRTVLIKKLALVNLDTDVVYREDGGKVKHLPTIPYMELTNLSSEGAFPVDQLMSSVLGQMLKQVFIKQNLNNMIQDVLKDPTGTVDKYLGPFKRFIPSSYNHKQPQSNEAAS
ncbi:MAG: AsmA family protein [Chlamydiales bacterium]|nr:AsmA family protein [Chlamydiales bacterium]